MSQVEKGERKASCGKLTLSCEAWEMDDGDLNLNVGQLLILSITALPLLYPYGIV